MDKNLAGYSKDVHGQLNVSVRGGHDQNIKYKLLENQVKIFSQFQL